MPSELGEQWVEMTGLEPVTPCLQSRCSSQLSYIPWWVRTASPQDDTRSTEHAMGAGVGSVGLPNCDRPAVPFRRGCWLG